jgi:hypothetical protein
LKKRIKPSEAGGAVEKWLVQVRMWHRLALIRWANSCTPVHTHQCKMSTRCVSSCRLYHKVKRAFT